ncbi:hepatic lectin-like [Centropristis striata]|uniref:hepatic lectin-like n=1 Tax=Centropristis striata TaxID=184440 RepID=UPI0027DF07FB|nr:hepatic lectin-like [Centropristis striata]
MSEAEVLNSERGRAHVNASMSEAKVLNSERGRAHGSRKQKESNGRCSATLEKVALVALGVLLVAYVITTAYRNFQIIERFQKLTDELDAVKRNLTVNRQSSSSFHCDPFIECPNLEKCWEQHRGNCYYFSNTVLTWEQSRDQCRSYRGDLVKIDSEAEQTFLELRLREKMNLPEDKFWIGLTDSETEGRWLWADGSPLDQSFTFWSSRQPDNWKEEDRDGEDCVRMGEKFGATDLKCWFDKTCKVPHRYICEKQQTQTTVTGLKCVSLTT